MGYRTFSKIAKHRTNRVFLHQFPLPWPRYKRFPAEFVDEISVVNGARQPSPRQPIFQFSPRLVGTRYRADRHSERPEVRRMIRRGRIEQILREWLDEPFRARLVPTLLEIPIRQFVREKAPDEFVDRLARNRAKEQTGHSAPAAAKI